METAGSKRAEREPLLRIKETVRLRDKVITMN